MTPFELEAMTRVTLGHLIHNCIQVGDFKHHTIPNELIAKGAIDLAKEVCRQLDVEKEKLTETL